MRVWCGLVGLLVLLARNERRRLERALAALGAEGRGLGEIEHR